MATTSWHHELLDQDPPLSLYCHISLNDQQTLESNVHYIPLRKSPRWREFAHESSTVQRRTSAKLSPARVVPGWGTCCTYRSINTEHIGKSPHLSPPSTCVEFRTKLTNTCCDAINESCAGCQPYTTQCWWDRAQEEHMPGRLKSSTYNHISLFGWYGRMPSR